jgi:hypothetical protein
MEGVIRWRELADEINLSDKARLRWERLIFYCPIPLELIQKEMLSS